MISRKIALYKAIFFGMQKNCLHKQVALCLRKMYKAYGGHTVTCMNFMDVMLSLFTFEITQ